jgi:phosphatidylserine/phosphatidylglycerophosphate/cardiolipin synthase-like enzyme
MTAAKAEDPVFHDPRSLAIHNKKRASLHAKCIVIDDERALITSANFTEAAHERNIEAGTVITDTNLAKALKRQFETLMDHGALVRVPGLGTKLLHATAEPAVLLNRKLVAMVASVSKEAVALVRDRWS